jgi:DNA replication and repair protein RecF
MDRLFQEGAAGRRRFLDRLVYALEPGHAREVAAFDTAMAQRNRLLADRHEPGRQDPAWLSALEDAMARHAVAATVGRHALVGRLNVALRSGVIGSFPAASLSVLCPIGERLTDASALTVEDWLRSELAASRARDAAAGSAAFGAHRADMMMADAATGIAAAHASTGQQKSLLIGVILGHAALLQESRGFAPLLLLDEPAVHLDPERRAALFDALTRLPAQVLLTGTDRDTFLPLRGVAEGLQIERGSLLQDPDFASG